MLVIGALHRPWCTEQSPQSNCCAFKQLWFEDVPFCTPVKGTECGLTISMRSCKKVYRFTKNARRFFFDCILARIHFVLIVNSQRLSLNLLRIFLRNKIYHLQTICPSAERRVTRTERPTPPALSDIPVELRLKIYNYIMKDTMVSAVGYRNGKQDAFYFKQRGYCPLMMTCKKFYYEGLDLYFENLTVNIKAACPSEFTGDMSNFGGPSFKNSLKRVRIADEDDDRRKRIESAFKHAKIEHSSKSARGSRKNAYYFA